MTNIFEYIANKIPDSFNFDIQNSKIVLVGVPEYLLSSVADILTYRFKKNIEISVLNEITEYTTFKDERFKLEIGSELDLKLFEKLMFERVSRVWNAGEYSVVGDVVTYLKRGDEYVTRISLFDTRIEKITLLDNNTRSPIKEISVAYLSNEQESESRYSCSQNIYPPKTIYYSRTTPNIPKEAQKIDITVRSIPGLSSNQINKVLKSYEKSGYEIYLSSQIEEISLDVKYTKLKEEINRGFVIASAKVVVVTDFELSGKIDLESFSKKKSNGSNIFKEITKGDYVVHEDHGIGIYNELIEQNNTLYLEVVYAGKDKLLIPLSASSKLSRYVGSSKGKPTLTGLNSGVWGRIKGRAKEDIMAMASELVKIYAIRKLTRTHRIIDTQEQIDELNDFISTFKFADTEDQRVITNEIVKDFKKSRPMDRLIVGDVGFGKTELAARAMFLACSAGMQSVILAPTTVLSMQHIKVLKERFSNYPFRIELLNRYVKGRQKDEILSDLKKGLIDIVVGTHSLLSTSVVFKNLGLLVIDEEQKFGVKQKEEIKKKRLDVNVLSMTATPIPRTLNMALSGIRDLSILASVPNGRKSIENVFSDFDFDIIVSAILKEIQRGGQVYYMHNRISDLNSIKRELESRDERIKAIVAHGGLSQKQITGVMNEFLENRANVLVCSSIIENGLDIPNVNTVIVDDAQRYGLSSLYQIRGRVGRSNRQAYAYFLHNKLSNTATMRLDALSEANNIGSGFILSNRDLEIRGAGNILGKSQSGVINSVGYALYTQMLSEAVSQLQKQKM